MKIISLKKVAISESTFIVRVRYKSGFIVREREVFNSTLWYWSDSAEYVGTRLNDLIGFFTSSGANEYIVNSK